jgi:uncharacterized membrane protein YjjP (DUF1212 family)
MVNVFQKKVLMMALYAGEIIMKSGAEIYRVEDTISRICKACGIDNVEVFATPTGIIVSLDKGGEADDTQTYVKRIKGISTDLKKISMVNKFSRKFAENSLNSRTADMPQAASEVNSEDAAVDFGMNVLRRIDRGRKYPIALRLSGAAMIAAAFCLIFGGSAEDCCISLITGAVSYIFSILLSEIDVNSFVRGFCCCALTAVLAFIAETAVPGASHDYIIIGTMMLFVPGMALTNSIRDFLSGDMLAGVARLAETVLIAVSLAAGAGVVVKLWNIIGGAVL